MNRNPSTIKNTRLALKNSVVLALGDKDVGLLKVTDASYIIEKGSLHGKYGASRGIIALRSLLKYLHDEGIPLPVHYSDFKVPVVPDKEVQYLTHEEREIVRSFINLNYPNGLRLRAMFEFMLRTGLRISEACAIRIDDIDFVNHEIRVENCKSKKWEVVYTHGAEEWVLKYLASRKDKNPFLFISNDGNRLTANLSKDMMRRLRKRIGGKIKKHIHWHILRKTFCTELLLNKTDIKSTQHLARHASERTTLRHYAAVNKQHSKKEHERVMSVLA